MMSRPPASNKVPVKDMYWFAHGGIENSSDKCLNQKEGDEENNDSTSPALRSLSDNRRAVDSSSSSGPSSLEMKDRHFEKHVAAEERRKQLWEAEQERHDAVLKKHLEREAALEARRNAQRSNISFAFGSSVPRNVESLAGGDAEKMNRHSNTSGLLPKEENHDLLFYRQSVSPLNSSGHRLEIDRYSPLPQSPQSNFNCERKAFSPPAWLVGSGALIGEDSMSKSMTAAVPAPRGRRKNDLMPAVPYERIPAPKASSASSTRKRSVSMTRLDQLAQPRKHYVEANKASSANSSVHKDTIKSPTRPLSSASEQSGGCGRPGSSAVRRVRSSPRKPRPISIAGTVPDPKMDIKVSPIKKSSAAYKKPQNEVKKTTPTVSKSTKPVEKQKSSHTATTPKPLKQLTSTPKQSKQPSQPKSSSSSPKTPAAKKAVTNKKKADIMVSSQPSSTPSDIPSQEASRPSDSPPPDNSEAERNNAKRIISEEEAKAALAEKRRLAREQAEKEAELERQRQEELKKQEEEQLRLEEEQQKRLEEEHLRLIEEHRHLEEEKLRKAIEENERKEEEERLKKEEELRLKAEQEKKAQEEAEKQRIELEEKLRKEEEERAERKKRLEKIMSRTRGKTTGSSPSGSISGSEQLDSGENQSENLSSGANSLDSNGPAEVASGPNSLDSNGPAEVVSGPNSLEGAQEKSEILSDGASMEAHPTYEVASDNESLHDIIMPKSETASQDNSLVILPDRDDFKASVIESLVETSVDDDPLDEATLIVDIENTPAMVSVKETSQEIVEDKTDNQAFFEESTEVVQQEKEILVEESIPKLDAPLLESMAVMSEGDVPAQSKKVSFNDEEKTSVDASAEAVPSEQGAGDSGMEHNSHFSTSSDIKLPDPIYENTSDEGSVSSEKQMDHSSFAFQEMDNPQDTHMMDDVFGEKATAHFEEAQFNPFEQKDNQSVSQSMAAYECQFDVGGMQDSMYAYETSDAPLPDVLDQPREFGEENVDPSISSTSSIADPNTLNFQTEVDNPVEKTVEDHITMQQSNPFNSFVANETDKQPILDSGKHDAQPEDNPILTENSYIPEQINGQIDSTAKLSDGDENINITIVKAEGSNECIGLITSVENDHISNDLAVQQNIQSEQFKSNFEYSSITDSEDSSLDSNLSQVMTGEGGDTKDLVGLINESSNSSDVKNGQAFNPFNEPAVNGNSDSKSNGDHFYTERETLKNGHKLESSKVEEIGNFVQLVDGNHISSVDHSNIFDNVDAVGFGKMSPDPFLAKGNSNQISGNPFLLQDEQKQVLMAPDFFN